MILSVFNVQCIFFCIFVMINYKSNICVLFFIYIKWWKVLQISSKTISQRQFVFAGNPNCPVSIYKVYCSKRPSRCNTPDSRFYLQPNKKCSLTEETWFTKQPLGKNTIGNLARVMAEQADIAGRKVNYSGRETAVTTLLHKDIAPTNIV